MTYRHIATGRRVFVETAAARRHCEGSPYWTSKIESDE